MAMQANSALLGTPVVNAPDPGGIIDIAPTDNAETNFTRVWTIDILGGGEYRGTAGDVPDYAQGKVVGNAFNWKYKVDLKVGDAIWNVGFDDWMYLLDDNVLINRAYVTRFGIRIGEVTIAFQK